MQLFQQFGVRVGACFPHANWMEKDFIFHPKRVFFVWMGHFSKRKSLWPAHFSLSPSPWTRDSLVLRGDGKQFPSSLLKRVDVIFSTRNPNKGRVITPKYFLVQPNKWLANPSYIGVFGFHSMDEGFLCSLVHFSVPNVPFGKQKKYIYWKGATVVFLFPFFFAVWIGKV